MKYRSDIDGLRAVAVLPVIFFHAGFEWAGGGFVGVDVFFVISGFLITSLILEERANGTFSILNFYERRARRILPALFLMMALCLVPAWIYMMPRQLHDFGQSLVAVTGFASNILFWREHDYFAPDSEEKPLLHTWSLTVEEQFYILFPLLIMTLWRIGHRRLFVTICALSLMSLIGAEWASRIYPTGNFFLLPGRAWELLAGALCTMTLFQNNDRRGSQALSLIGLGMILYAVFCFDKYTPFPSLYALVPVIGTVFILLYSTPGTLVCRILQTRILMGIGLISYSAYLCHYPLFTFARLIDFGTPSPFLMGALGLASLPLGWLGWRYVETPFRQKMNGRYRIGRKWVWIFSALGMIAFFGIGMAAHISKGWEGRLPAHETALLEYRNYEKIKLYRQGECFLRQNQAVSDLNETCVTGIEQARYMILGDSHAAAIYHGIKTMAAKNGDTVIQINGAGCPPVFDFDIKTRTPPCRDISDMVQTYLPKFHGTLILHANWRSYMDQDGFPDALDASLRMIDTMGYDAVLVLSVPQWNPALPDFLVRYQRKYGPVDHAMHENKISVYTPHIDTIRRIDADIRAIAQKHNIRIASIIENTCRDDKPECTAMVRNDGGQWEPVAWDYGHMTAAGSEFVAKILWPKITDTIE